MRVTQAGLLALAMAATAQGACNRHTEAVVQPPRTPAEALSRVRAAAGSAATLFDLLDQSSQWSVMSIRKDLAQICTLVRTRYPRRRRERELERCQMATEPGEVAQFFARLSAAHRLLQPLRDAKTPGPLQVSGDRAEAGKVVLCREERTEDVEGSKVKRKRWTYCGLAEQLEALKIKASRDLITTQENAEAYGGSGR